MKIQTGDKQADARIAVLVEKIQSFVDNQLKESGFTGLLEVQPKYDQVTLLLNVKGDNHAKFQISRVISIPSISSARDEVVDFMIERIVGEFTSETVDTVMIEPSKQG